MSGRTREDLMAPCARRVRHRTGKSDFSTGRNNLAGSASISKRTLLAALLINMGVVCTSPSGEALGANGDILDIDGFPGPSRTF